MDLTWNRSTSCASGNCVEVAYRRSSYCSSGSCVEVGHGDGWILLRDSKIEDSPVLKFSPPFWAWILDRLKTGGNVPTISPLPDGGVRWILNFDRHSPVLTFTGDEWDAFLKGIAAGEFTAEALAHG